MSLKARIQDDMKTAMRARTPARLSAIACCWRRSSNGSGRAHRARRRRRHRRHRKMVKQRRDAAAQFDSRQPTRNLPPASASRSRCCRPTCRPRDERRTRRRDRRVIAECGAKVARRHGQDHDRAQAATGRPRRHGEVSRRVRGSNWVPEHRLRTARPAHDPQSFIQDLLGRVDIVDVIERHLPLKKGGANYFACCPFHGEKSRRSR
jgi:hypothetical protein